MLAVKIARWEGVRSELVWKCLLCRMQLEESINTFSKGGQFRDKK
jgi:hypothetical protein